MIESQRQYQRTKCNQVDREKHVRRRDEQTVEELEIQQRDGRNVERNIRCQNAPEILLLQNEAQHEH